MNFNLQQEAAALSEYWSPKILGQVNDQYLKVAKLKGDFAWHSHDNEDELFIILAGQLTIQYESYEIHLNTGDVHIVPKGVRHNPVCAEECLVALIETVTTQHTGSEVTAMTKSIAVQLGEQKS